ncbi:MAG: hypothetical protein Q8P52_02015 [bacterium]|nr:hypothetical protein [bacterium]
MKKIVFFTEDGENVIACFIAGKDAPTRLMQKSNGNVNVIRVVPIDENAYPVFCKMLELFSAIEDKTMQTGLSETLCEVFEAGIDHASADTAHRHQTKKK